MKTSYAVTTKHDRWADGNGTFELIVTSLDGQRYVSGGPFGCSRDYCVQDDEQAIRKLLAEHATTCVRIERRKWRA